MKIDGYDVKPGDKLWHVVLGEGTVTEVTTEGAVRVTFGQANYLFGANLRRPGERVRTLYWQNPVLVLPPPAALAPTWAAIRDITMTVAGKIAAIPLAEA